MKPADIGYTVCFVLWFFNFVMVQITRKEENDYCSYKESNFFLILEIVCLGFMWVFFGLSKNWW